ncbi:hypothetical protein [uncultured Dokdonia sp.]|uniref:hypothetical protein n=1 Tax=uncultured Dokdonia sp. TaxID=575653 RepID=UPI0026269906|nr:hypothetical protein [uncultured Dokdonia sp.]
MDHGSVNKQLEANRALLPKRKKQKFSYASSKDETNRFTKKATPEQLQEIRDCIQKEKKQEQKKFILITIVSLVIVYFIATGIDWSWWFKSFK